MNISLRLLTKWKKISHFLYNIFLYFITLLHRYIKCGNYWKIIVKNLKNYNLSYGQKSSGKDANTRSTIRRKAAHRIVKCEVMRLRDGQEKC